MYVSCEVQRKTIYVQRSVCISVVTENSIPITISQQCKCNVESALIDNKKSAVEFFKLNLLSTGMPLICCAIKNQFCPKLPTQQITEVTVNIILSLTHEKLALDLWYLPLRIVNYRNQLKFSQLIVLIFAYWQHLQMLQGYKTHIWSQYAENQCCWWSRKSWSKSRIYDNSDSNR